MANRYNLSLLFYPQPDGQYHVTCPDLPHCFTCGSTMDEARERIFELISEILPDEIQAGMEDEESLRFGMCMEGKSYQEISVTVDSNGEVVFPSSILARAAAAEMTA